MFRLMPWSSLGIPTIYVFWSPVVLGAFFCLLFPIKLGARIGIMMLYTPAVATGYFAALLTLGCLLFGECP
jgi:hypothetical protein